MPENLLEQIETIAKRARSASLSLTGASEKEKNQALEAIAQGLESNRKTLLQENKRDLNAAEDNGLSPAMVDRLKLDDTRIDAMAKGVRQLIDLADPVGKVIETKTRPNGLEIRKTRVPIGVIGIIYESRPNVTIDCAGHV